MYKNEKMKKKLFVPYEDNFGDSDTFKNILTYHGDGSILKIQCLIPISIRNILYLMHTIVRVFIRVQSYVQSHNYFTM